VNRKHRSWRVHLAVGAGVLLVVGGPLGIVSLCQSSKAGPPSDNAGWAGYGREHLQGPNALAGTWYNLPGDGPTDGCGVDGCVTAGRRKKGKHKFFQGGDAWYPPCCGPGEVGGSWFWMRSPEQERVAMSSLFNRYCIRCHAVDGRGVWDIPGVPNFTNQRWQLSRSDDQIARIIIEGRGAVMPTFRGTLTLEEAWAMARYLRTLVPGTETPRPDVGRTEKEKSGPAPEERPPSKGK
jgi:hypothetical protein